MNPLESTLRTVADDLRKLDRRAALVGGLAVSTRAEPRMTRDADLAVAVQDDDDAEQVVHSFMALGYQLIATIEQEATGRLATVRLTSPDGNDRLVIDLLFASSGIEVEIVEAADELVVFDGLTMPVATVGHLIAMKLLARDDRRRPTDAADLASLAAIATPGDWQQASVAAALIAERGFARNRDLDCALRTLRADGAY